MISALREIDIEDPAWDGFVSAQPAATAFHVPAWTKMLRECYGYRASALILTDAGGDIRAGLPFMRVRRPLLGERGICLPFTDNCAPLLGPGQRMDELASALAVWRAGARPRGLPLSVRAALPEVSGWVQTQSAVVHSLKLTGNAADVFRTFKRTQVQQCIVKAERAGVSVSRGESFDDMRVFFDLHLKTRRRLGAPVQPLRFFRLVWERVLSRGLGFVLVAFHQGAPIAGAVFLAWNRTLIYKYSASDDRYWSLRPNNLVLWTAIRWACENGFSSVDFGRTEVSNQGLRTFKNGWGTCEEPLVYSALADGSPDHAIGLPPVAARLAATLIRRAPTWVCRGTGEVFYRYAA